MDLSPAWGRLPAFVALETLAVEAGVRPGASVQLDDSYFEGMGAVLRAADRGELGERRATLKQSKEVFDDINVEMDSVTRSSLREASAKLHGVFRELPEVGLLQSTYPGEAFVVPEWLRRQSDGRLRWGARVYFFREGEAPPPTSLVDRNIEAVLEGELGPFEAHRGELHGYPECCVAAFSDRPDRGDSPEWRSVESLADLVDEARLGDRSESVRDVVGGLLAEPRAKAFFAREFFPEPGCERALKRGEAVYDALADRLPETVVEDYVRLNYAYCYAVADALASGARQRPAVGELGLEHVLFYLPLARTLNRERYR
jgi:hypothetical protein